MAEKKDYVIKLEQVYNKSVHQVATCTDVVWMPNLTPSVLQTISPADGIDILSDAASEEEQK